MSDNTDSLLIRQLNISRQSKSLISLTELRVKPGEVATIVGPSGSGKSTLLRWVLGEPLHDFNASGELWLGGKRMDKEPIERRQIGLMYQKGDLFPHLTVLQNLLFALPRVGKAEQRQRAEQALQAVGLQHKRTAMPDELSGGEQSRIALIRSLLAEPEAILLDEPFSALDEFTRSEMQKWLLDIWQSNKRSILFVTHNIEEALFLADRILVLSEKPARVVAEFQVEFTRPRAEDITLTEEFLQYKKDIYKVLKKGTGE